MLQDHLNEKLTLHLVATDLQTAVRPIQDAAVFFHPKTRRLRLEALADAEGTPRRLPCFESNQNGYLVREGQLLTKRSDICRSCVNAATCAFQTLDLSFAGGPFFEIAQKTV